MGVYPPDPPDTTCASNDTFLGVPWLVCVLPGNSKNPETLR